MQQFNRRRARSATGAAVLLLLLQPALAARVEQDGLVTDGVAPAPAALEQGWARYRQARATRLLDWLADGSLLVAARRDGRVQLHRVGAPLDLGDPIATPGQAVSDAAAHPSDPKTLALRVVGGDGHAQLFSQHVGDAAAGTLTDASGHDDAPLWAHDGRRLAFASDRRNGRDFDVYLIEAGSAAGPRLVIGGGGRWRVLDWSPDDRLLLLRREAELQEARLYVGDVAAGSVKPIEPAATGRPSGGRIFEARFTRDGSAVLYLCDGSADGFVRLRLAALDGSPPRDLTPPLQHDIEHFALSADGRYLAYTWDEGGFSRLAITDQRNHLDLKPPAGLPIGVVNALRFERSGTRFALEIETSTAPPDVFVVDAATAAWTRWTQSEPAVPGAAPPAPALRLRFPSWDRSGGWTRELGGFVYLPQRPGRFPVLVLLHDGPESRFRPGFDAWLQFLVSELGVAVVTPNLRGSSGAGRAFASLDDGPQREDAIRDIGSLLVWIGVQPGLDASRVVLMGRGYGGYQALAALAQYGDRLRAAVAIDPLADLVAAADTAAANGSTIEYGSSGDAEQRALLQRLSPLGFAGSILRPVLLASLDGVADGGLSGAEQILWRMRASHRDAAYLAVDPQRCGINCEPVRAAAWAAISGYLQDAYRPDVSGTGP